jgi:hypothetical protein
VPTAPTAPEFPKPVKAQEPGKKSDALAQVRSTKPVGAAPEIAKPVKAPQPAKRSDAPAQPLISKPVGVAPPLEAARTAAPETTKPVKAPQPAKRSDASAQALITRPVGVASVEAARTAAPEIAKPVKAPQPAKRSDASVQPFRRHEASPRIGEKYLQIAAFGPRALDGYLKTLEGQGLHPLVAPGPVDSIYRILVGPFASPEALEETRRSIQASGIEPILRSY